VVKADCISILQVDIDFPDNGNGMFNMKLNGNYLNTIKLAPGEWVAANDPVHSTLWTAAKSLTNGTGYFQ
jgi:hypothetical protein